MAEAAKGPPGLTILLLRDSAGPDVNGADDKGRGEIGSLHDGTPL